MIDTPEGPIPEPPMEDLVNAPRRAPSSPEAAPAGRTPPHSIEAEQGILGCLMLDAASGLDFCLERIREPRQLSDAPSDKGPRGKRRPGGMGNYWMNDFQYATWRDDLEEHFIVIPQIETRAGVDNVQAIVSHPLVTALGLGPYDLSADMGCCWDPDDADHRDAISRIRAAADAAGKKMWICGDVSRLVAEGYTFLWIGTVSILLKNAFADALATIRGDSGREARGAASPPPA